MNQVTVDVDGQTKLFEAESGVLLSELLQKERLSFSMPCAGNHTCGKCKFKGSGAFSAPTPDELKFLNENERRGGVRLACFAKIEGDCQAFLEKKPEGGAILSQTGTAVYRVNPRTPDGYGLAVDIGTTTVVVYLYRLADGELLCVRSGMNAQCGFGADVISRINYCNENGLASLQEAIVSQINRMVAEALSAVGASPETLKEIVIAGNTTMLHLLTGLDPYGIAVYPFTPVSLFGNELKQGFFKSAPDARVYLPGCISSYVGGDITCSILASGMTGKKAALLLDLGTNGEMALWYHDKFYCCSTAAGPAFEGAGMQMGMTAVDGAVSKVWEENGEVRYSVLGEDGPAAIGGSGIIGAVCGFGRLGLIDDTGRIDEKQESYARYGTEFGGFPALKIGDSGVLITQQDIRKLQLAKSAVAAGISTLLHESGCEMEEVEALYLAGGFGTYISVESAVGIGLFPGELKEKTVSIGNGAGAGASMLLLDRDALKEEKKIMESAQEVNLSSNPVFMDHYVEQMMF